MGKILLENMEFFSYHGHFSEEQIVGNKFLVNLELHTEMTKASLTDNLDDALDYQRAYQLVRQEMEKRSHLLEHIAGRILTELFKAFENLEHAIIKVSKMNPPMGGMMRCVSVEIEKHK